VVGVAVAWKLLDSNELLGVPGGDSLRGLVIVVGRAADRDGITGEAGAGALRIRRRCLIDAPRDD